MLSLLFLSVAKEEGKMTKQHPPLILSGQGRSVAEVVRDAKLGTLYFALAVVILALAHWLGG